LTRLISPLLEVIERQKTYVEDDFQARVCLGWVHWVLGEPGLAASRLPGSVEQDFSQLEGTNKESTMWSKVCALQATYIKGSSLSLGGSLGDALETFESAMPILSAASPQLHTMAEMRHWTELLLTKFCVLSSHSIRNKLSPWLETETLTAFRSWADFWERQTVKGSRVLGGYAGEADVSRRQVWKEYYATLSFILEHDLPYPTSIMATAYSNPATRLMQKAELERVGASYENLLLKEVQFPRAEQWNEEVEDWVNLVMKNWRVLCGPSWQEHELGAGGRQEVSRKVLGILYNAATKTFHSTQILRDLFTVHLAVADFDIALKCFDTYLEIVKRSKSRVEKTGELEEGLDNDETILKTASECIRALCTYGTLNAAEKAKDLAHYLKTWLEKHDPSFAQGDQVIGVQNGNGRLIENGHMTHSSPEVSPYIIAQTWRAIGISQAQWARLTYDANSRPDSQAKAIKSLRRSLLPDYGRTDDTDTLYALALVLAERRELEQAIAVVKAALLPRQSSPIHAHSFTVRFARERSLIPLWHLLALLLSARQEFTTAARMCEGAFEQFKDVKNLFGDLKPDGNFQSEHLNRSLQEKLQLRNRGVVDDMDDFEKESVLEVKITQLILTEIIDGSNAAVNASDELFSLYARLFDEPKALVSAQPTTTHTKPPTSPAGTLRSVKGSIFGRSRRSIRKPSGAPTAGSTIEENASLPSRPQTSQTAGSAPTQGPTIHITAETGAASYKHRRRSQSTNPKTPQSRKDSLTRKKSSTSVGKRIASASGQTSSPINDNETGSRPIPIISSMPQKEKALKPSASGMQNTRLPELPPPLRAANPGVRFSFAQAKRHRIGILVRVWLLVAGFYRRAELFEDAKGAIDEAYKLVEAMELDVSQDDSGKVSIADAGWGFCKSVEEQWADVWAEVSTYPFYCPEPRLIVRAAWKFVFR
jgi:tetratricopeptide (TPR) repeat protein